MGRSSKLQAWFYFTRLLSHLFSHPHALLLFPAFQPPHSLPSSSHLTLSQRETPSFLAGCCWKLRHQALLGPWGAVRVVWASAMHSLPCLSLSPFIHPPFHSPTQPVTPSFTHHSFTPSIHHPFTHPLTHPSIHLFNISQLFITIIGFLRQAIA